ncbi:exopolysaccharide biosynthesis polyprenyl glycosylphosphotransferase [Sphingomonas sp. MMS24-J45]|uniref:exopolysaccharide biosynthesis polyprenyl glycosylphosphotransferase n=1 Tax=Sphingomonas sp. MMS24-J45 TaxID=3238806 RepID=UPI00384F4A41
MLQARLRSRDGQRRVGVQRYRYQLLVGLLVAVVLPSLIRGLFDSRDLAYFSSTILEYENSRNSLLASIVGLILGVSLFRRLCNFPGVRSYEYVLPSFFTSYGIVTAALLMFRLEYIVSVVVTSFALAMMTFFVICYLNQRHTAYLFHVVPCGDMSRLQGIRHVDWEYLREPVLPEVPGSGIVVDLRAEIGDEWERLLAQAALAGVPVYHSKQLLESITGQVEIEHISENNLGSLNPNDGYGRVKQFADLVIALIALPLFSPFLLLIALAIRLDSPGPVLFRQLRMGFRGRPFEVYKFRTMRPVAAPGTHDDARRAAITHSDDDRITRIGRILRRTRIDEIPQILNILRGEMSWIGPRPEAMALSAWYQSEISFYSYRHVVKPGITGWAQVNQGHVAEIHDVHYKLCYDFYYIKYLSAWLDALIVFRTIRTVLTGSGAK